ncbi:DUF4247 domain-containing protein [Nocardia zapadnayensis]|uniref:DUF4247 domain-containing protein n=1 Tax=Nocardia rhamnosiphila TaxID=426716 RepID=UPI002246DAD2|nr:DUF4247 domain-containing protein [Nocardia zapadnayensis]MCX0274175.1 DUF4247 domain-containing protein [Nocardia zapadnayensis]
MSRKSWVVAALCAVLAVVLSGCGSDDDDDDNGVRAYITSHYARAPKLDEANNGLAYTAGKSPTATADEITKAARPLDRRTAGATTYLQYRNDIVAITPNGSGAKILLDDYRTGHRRHHSAIAFFGWPSDNTGFRGGGSGDGK